MAFLQIRTAVLLMACVALISAPSLAQGGNRHGRGQRAQPRGGGQSNGRVAAQRKAVPRRQVKFQGRAGSRIRVEPQRRTEPQGRVGTTVPRRRVATRLGVGNSSRKRRTFNTPRYGDRPYVSRSYVRPFGYRPNGYRPGWSLNLYFGQPYYSTHRSSRLGYGYYAAVPGRGYGAVRIVDAPRDAHVFVDGYYAGVVDDYDGVFQHLKLEAGSHHIEIEAEGYPLIAFDVRVWPGRTITYRANLR